MDMARPGTKPRIDEDDFRPRTLAQATQLRSALEAAGVRRTQANNVVGWLIHDDELGGSPESASVIRSNYRSCLLKLGSPPWKGTEAKGTFIRRLKRKTPPTSHYAVGEFRSGADISADLAA
jgi:hypothetical protein